MWLHWKGRGATARSNEYRLLGSLWQEEGEVDAEEPSMEEPLQQREAAEVAHRPLLPGPRQFRYHKCAFPAAHPERQTLVPVTETHRRYLCSQELSTIEGGWGALLNRRYRRIMILASALPILQQASGINTVVFYSSDVGPEIPRISQCHHTKMC